MGCNPAAPAGPQGISGLSPGLLVQGATVHYTLLLSGMQQQSQSPWLWLAAQRVCTCTLLFVCDVQRTYTLVSSEFVCSFLVSSLASHICVYVCVFLFIFMWLTFG